MRFNVVASDFDTIFIRPRMKPSTIIEKTGKISWERISNNGDGPFVKLYDLFFKMNLKLGRLTLIKDDMDVQLFNLICKV